ncbi:hypothetical protein [Spirosoma sp. KNUC1025]|uniref:hypothetical protein n=1 Tax=Spirosoma sp. KNUC1025 TaxID=2894082 RepID=UPI003863159A|nr:hypothetical protein LN737_21880 [Spirosoma sp. KNUC1025]
MTDETYIFRDKQIQDNNLELTFHKDVPWSYNSDPFPVIKYCLTNCKSINDIDFDHIDYYNDGLVITVTQIDNLFQFKTTDMGGSTTIIVCEDVERKVEAYSQSDLIYLINEITKQRDDEYDSSNKLREKLADLKKSLTHELDTITRKINQANWLSDDKRNYLEGKQETLKNVIDRFDNDSV